MAEKSYLATRHIFLMNGYVIKHNYRINNANPHEVHQVTHTHKVIGEYFLKPTLVRPLPSTASAA